MNAPKLPSFIKLNRHKIFEYKPRYYNEAKEKLEKRIEKIKKEVQAEEKSLTLDKIRLREKIQERWSRGTYSKGVSQSNYRIVVIILVLILLAYLLLK